MQCYLLNGNTLDQLTLSERPAPVLTSPRDVLVDVEACSLNYRDLLVATGRYGPGTYPPFIPVSDMAGVVKAIGSSVTEFAPGDRVLNAPFRHWPAGTLRSAWAKTFIGAGGVDGVLAEQITYPADSLVKAPVHLDFNEASTLTIAGLTAWAAIVTHGKLRPGEWVLLHGTGGVSLFAAQLAKSIGAKIILTSSDPKKAAKVKDQYDIYATLNYRDENWSKQVRELTGGHGVDVVVDVAGGDILAQSLQACAYGARVAVIGLLSGLQSNINIIDLLHHQITLRGIFMESTQELISFANAVDTLKLKPVVDKVFTFGEVRDAYQHMLDQKHIGKVVIKLYTS